MSSDLDYNSIIPLYAQIAEKLQFNIRIGIFRQTGRLPAEDKLSEQYQVSRITIRKAVDELVRCGLVEKRQGKGTFICDPKMSHTFLCTPKMTCRVDSGFINFTEMCAENGVTARTKILEAGINRPDSEEICEMLGLTSGEPAIRIRCLRYAGDKPLVLEDNFYSLEYSCLLSIDLENDSAYRYLQEEKGIELQCTSMGLSMIHADSELAKLLQVSCDTPQLEIKGRVARLDGQIVYTSYQAGYGENFKFIIR